MFIGERHQAILEMLAEKDCITNREIRERFGISYDSAKRDLRILEEKELLKRTHGGAVPMRRGGRSGSGPKQDLSEEGRGAAIKERYLSIAKRAVQEIGTQEVVYVTGASVGYRMAQNMPEDRIFTVVTNSIAIARELRSKGNITVFLAGGAMNANGSRYDGFSCEILKRLRFDKCFITSACISPEFGLSIPKSCYSELINAVIGNSRRVYGLYPAEKIGGSPRLHICGASGLNVLITDAEAAAEDLQAFEKAGVEIMIS